MADLGGREVRAATAANFADAAAELARRWEARSGARVRVVAGASGPFAAQILRGAPFDVFLSADAARARAVAQAAGTGDSLFTYAVGRLALWSRDRGRLDGEGRVLRAPGAFRRLAIADPAAAPYGQAAVEALRALGLLDALRPRIVQGASIAQAYQFVATGAAELGLVAWSQVLAHPGGSRWLVPERLHAPIAQAACLTAAGAREPAAAAFLQWLRGPEAVAAIRRFGYRAG